MHRFAGGTLVIGALAGVMAACASGGSAGPAPDPVDLTYADQLQVDFDRMERTSSGLWMEQISPGTGSAANRGDQVWIHYIGWLPDGTIVDSSLGREPFQFELGSNQVIRGWNQGVVGMKVGERRRFVIRPGLAYGHDGLEGRVPPNSVLVFEIQLVDAS